MANDDKNNLILTGLSNRESSQIDLSAPYIIDTIDIIGGEVPIVKTQLEFADRLGSWKVRWSIGRSRYRVTPGLYATGRPDENSPVFLSANYKMSFDRLRSNLKGIDGWILVLDTKGINVWCAAGKGTFGTDEIISRIAMTKLSRVVSHRKIIAPQLGAPGTAAHKVKEISGFRIEYGPVRSEDIPDYLNNKHKATEEMRRVHFRLWDRLVLIPNDLVLSLKHLLYGALLIFALSGLGNDLYNFERLISVGFPSIIFIFLIYILGHSLPPALLPYLPGRSFSSKGAWAGLIAFGIVYLLGEKIGGVFNGNFDLIGWFGLSVAVSSFIAMNFTGASTYTSLSGVKKEMKVAVPLQLIVAVFGLGFLIIGKFV